MERDVAQVEQDNTLWKERYAQLEETLREQVGYWQERLERAEQHVVELELALAASQTLAQIRQRWIDAPKP